MGILKTRAGKTTIIVRLSGVRMIRVGRREKDGANATNGVLRIGVGSREKEGKTGFVRLE